MKHLKYITVIMFGILLTMSPAHADIGVEQSQLLQSYFEHLEKGDTAAILSLLDDPLLSRKKAMLASNPAYPAFIARLYQDSDIHILSIEEIDAYSSTADVEVFFQGEPKPATVKILMKKINGQWKIVDESEEN
jgi:hypothetical protein